jgi:hypothetical protein
MRSVLPLVLFAESVVAAPAAGVEQPEPAHVVYVTKAAVFVNRGSLDGLAVGQRLSFMRKGRPVGECEIEAVADNQSRCRGASLEEGDGFTAAKGARPVPLMMAVQPLDAGRAWMYRLFLARVRWQEVDFSEPPRAPRRPRLVSFAFSHSTFASLAGGGEAFHQQRLDLAAYDVGLYRGLSASIDLSVLFFASEPASSRSPYTGSAQLLVRAAELSFRRPDVPVTAAIGRTWLRGVPGQLLLDGAQAGFKVGGLEVGAYGGWIPDAVTLMPSRSQWTAGAFLRAKESLGSGPQATRLMAEARVGWAVRDLVGQRLEVAAAGHASFGAVLAAHAAVELGLLGSTAVALDAARVDVTWQPWRRLRLQSGAHLRGQSTSGILELGVASWQQATMHADLAAVLEVAPWLLVSLQGGGGTVFSSELLQARAGPEVTVLGLAGSGSALSLAYAESVGWLRGRDAQVRLLLVPTERLRLSSTVSWFQLEGPTGSEALAAHELSASLSATVSVFRWLWARALVVVRGRPEGLTGVTATGQLGGDL